MSRKLRLLSAALLLIALAMPISATPVATKSARPNRNGVAPSLGRVVIEAIREILGLDSSPGGTTTTTGGTAGCGPEIDPDGCPGSQLLKPGKIM
jgi:hypothetical protein